MPTTRRSVRLSWIFLVTLGLLTAAGCSQPVPRSYGFQNATQTTIQVVHQDQDGHESVVAEKIPPGVGFSIDVLNTDVCNHGVDIARDLDGRELARHEHDGCRSWFITDGSPIPFTISNKSKIPLTIVYLGPPVIVVANTILPNAELASTVQAFGDPAAICYGVLVARNSVSHEIARHQLSGCDDWTWKINP